jgi:dienelactone hydrolase
MKTYPRPSWLAVMAAMTAICGLALAYAPANASGSASATAAGRSPAPAARGTSADSTSAAGVVIDDITIDVPHGPAVAAYVVRPAGHLAPQSQAGILFLHWLGQIHNDRTEYLPEAVTLASKGVVSVLPQGTFPWVGDPVGTTQDVRSVRHQEAAYQQALDTLAAIPAVDPARIGLDGHDYGAMYGALVADSDSRVSAMVLETPDALFGNWFAKYWLALHGQERADYLALFHGLDPVDHTARLGDHVFFQWAGKDVFIGEKVRDKYAASSPDAQVKLYANADHLLDDVAMGDRDAFLAAQLGFGG